jgi:gliding motility-associated-like protein
MRSIIALFIVTLWTFSPLYGQVFLLDGSTPNISACGGSFFDSGGETANYNANEDFTTTICSDGSGPTHIRLTFLGGIQIGPGDQLCFYDGTDINAMELACDNEFLPNQTNIVQATAANPSGCITVQFQSNNIGQSSGWGAEISCVPSCQIVQAQLINSIPAVSPPDTGWIDICPGDTVFFEAVGFYPQDSLIYDQEDATSSFLWDFGDGDTLSGSSVYHIFEEPGGYRVQVDITDVAGCSSTNFISQRVRVAAPPRFLEGSNLPSEICLGDSIELVATINDSIPSSAFSVIPTEEFFVVEGIRSDSIALPDGTGVAYETSIAFDQFLPGQTLDNIDDLLGICIIMEHSWMRDLEISLSCPDGTTVVLHDHPNNLGDEVFLGAPIDDDDIILVPGIGWEYCWTPDAINGTFLDFANTFDPDTLPSGDYSSFDDLTDLLGCPLNGEWTIHVEDLWLLDNGFIFSWSILFDQSIYPNLETFTPGIVDFSWVNNSSIYSYSTDSIAASPQNPGEVSYVLQVTDEYGCEYENHLDLQVLPLQHPNCFDCGTLNSSLPDTLELCEGDTILIDGTALFTDQDSTVTFENISNAPFQNDGQTGASDTSMISVNSLLPNTIVDATVQIEQICLNVETADAGAIDLLLVAPDGSQLPLSNGNGAGGANFINTCFSPDATNPISSGTAPFSGDFQPDGAWNTLDGAPLNGDWQLVVINNQPNNGSGQIISWTITFQIENNFTYSWTPGTSISCTDCPMPQVYPDADQTYIVTATDSYNCQRMDSVYVQIVPLQPAPDVNCEVTDFNQLTFTWDSIPGFSDYEVNVNGNGWEAANQSLAHIINGLSIGEFVTVEVRGISANFDCPSETGTATCEYTTPCFLDVSLASQEDPSCFGASDGILTVEVSNAQGNTFFILDAGIPQSSGTFIMLSEGSYLISASDQVGCTDTLTVTLTAPPPLAVSLDMDTSLCFAANDAAIQAIGSGGTGMLNYSWSGPDNFDSDMANIQDLQAGDYCLNVEDENACTLDTCVNLPEPPEILTNIVLSPPLCADSEDGIATATAIGGVGGFSFSWSDSQTGPNALNLAGGTYFVSVEDANGCVVIDTAILEGPAPLVITALTETPAQCNGEDNGEITLTVEGGISPYNYLWDDPINQSTNPATGLSQGSYAVTITDNNGCTLVGGGEISEPPALTLNLITEDVLCNGDSTGSVAAIVNGGVLPYSYQWTNLSTSDSTVANLNAGDYALEVTDGNGCTIASNFSILEPATAVMVDITQTFISCSNENNSIALAEASGGVGNYTYLWSDNQDEEEATQLAPQIYFITVTDASGCTAVSDIFIQEFEPISAALEAVLPNCNGEASGSISVTQVSGGAGNGSPGDYVFSWSTNPVQTGPVAMGLEGGDDYVLTITDAQGCTNSFTQFLEDPDAIELSIAPQNVNCFGANDGSALAEVTGPNSGFTFQWSNNVENPIDSLATLLPAGNYALTVTDDLGCTGSTSFSISEPEQIQLSFETTANNCYNSEEGSISLEAEGGVPAYTYEWSTGSTDPSIQNLSQGNYTVTVTDSDGCTVEGQAQVGAPPAISAIINTKGISCFGDADGTLVINPQGGTPPYLFSLDGEDYNGVSTVVGLEAGVYAVYIQDSRGCIWQTAAEVKGTFQLFVDAGPDLEIELGDSIALDYSTGGFIGSPSIFWEQPYPGTLSCPDCIDCDSLLLYCETPTAGPNTTTSYTVNVIDERGCTASDEVIVRVRKERSVYVPTAFTPDGMGGNDILYVRGRPGTKVLTFQIYNRWGEQVFQANDFEINDPLFGWDGKFREKEMNTGLYVWYLEVEYIDGQLESRKGQTMLMR